MPIVTTLHTILAAPDPAQRAVMDELTRLSDRLVVMSSDGAVTPAIDPAHPSRCGSSDGSAASAPLGEPPVGEYRASVRVRGVPFELVFDPRFIAEGVEKDREGGQLALRGPRVIRGDPPDPHRLDTVVGLERALVDRSPPQLGGHAVGFLSGGIVGGRVDAHLEAAASVVGVVGERDDV